MSGGFLSCLALLFIALKLTGVIAWPWMWVLAPVWIPLALLLAFVLAYILFSIPPTRKAT